MEPPETIELRTERLRLRPFVPADAPELQRLASAREIAAGTLTVPHPYPDGAAEAWIARHPARLASGTAVVLAVELAEEPDPRPGDSGGAPPAGQLLGAIGIEIEPDHARGELGYWIGTPFWGRGFATEAARAMIEYGFRELGLHRITAAFFATNPSSGRVLEKVGMTREGVRRSHYRKFGRFVDSVVMGMLREEFEERASAPEDIA